MSIDLPAWPEFVGALGSLLVVGAAIWVVVRRSIRQRRTDDVQRLRDNGANP